MRERQLPMRKQRMIFLCPFFFESPNVPRLCPDRPDTFLSLVCAVTCFCFLPLSSLLLVFLPEIGYIPFFIFHYSPGRIGFWLRPLIPHSTGDATSVVLGGVIQLGRSLQDLWHSRAWGRSSVCGCLPLCNQSAKFPW